jgi:hypothetical protein
MGIDPYVVETISNAAKKAVKSNSFGQKQNNNFVKLLNAMRLLISVES